MMASVNESPQQFQRRWQSVQHGRVIRHKGILRTLPRGSCPAWHCPRMAYFVWACAGITYVSPCHILLRNHIICKVFWDGTNQSAWLVFHTQGTESLYRALKQWDPRGRCLAENINSTILLRSIPAFQTNCVVYLSKLLTQQGSA